MKNKHLAEWALFSGIVIGTAGMIIAPMGIIDSSVLYMTGQLFILCATLCGFGEVTGKFIDLINEMKGLKK